MNTKKMVNQLLKVKQGKKTKYKYCAEHLYDSKEEIYFLWWLMDLKERSIISNFTSHPKTFELIPPSEYLHVKRMKKTKDKIIRATLLPALEYTSDFMIEFDVASHEEGFTYNLNYEDTPVGAHTNRGKICVDASRMAWVDVKGGFSVYNNHREFAIKQKITKNVLGIYVQKVEPLSLFKYSFYPKRFYLTDRGRQRRKIKNN